MAEAFGALGLEVGIGDTLTLQVRVGETQDMLCDRNVELALIAVSIFDRAGQVGNGGIQVLQELENVIRRARAIDVGDAVVAGAEAGGKLIFRTAGRQIGQTRGDLKLARQFEPVGIAHQSIAGVVGRQRGRIGMFAFGLVDVMPSLADHAVELRQHRLVLLGGDVDFTLRLGHVVE